MELLPTGLVLDTLDEIIDGFNQAELAGIASTLNLNAPDPIAVMNGVIAERLQSIEEAVGAMYSGMQPDGASDDGLTGLALITGTMRQPATKTLVACTITVDAACGPFAAGTMLASVNGAPNLIYTNVDSFTAGGAGSTTGVIFECTETGENVVNASTLTVISSPLLHWTAITNPANGVVGQPIQTDASLRQAQQAELALGGAATAAALAADILHYIQPSQSPLTIPGIKTGTDATNNPFTISAATVSVTVLWNDTDSTDADGLPPHSIEVIAYAPDAGTEDTDALCALILADKSAGIQTHCGTASVTYKTITDNQGISEDIYYSRPEVVETDIDVTVKAKPGHTVDEDEVRNAIMVYVSATLADGTPVESATANWTPGATAYASSIVGAVFAYDISGVADVTGVVLSAANVGANVVPTKRQIVQVTDPPSANIHVTIT